MTTKTNKSVTAGPPIWFITGCSTGFGRELATQALERGFRTVVTARQPDEVEAPAAAGEALVLKLDVTDQGQIKAAIKVMVVEPSGFRTDWAGRSANESKKQIADYARTAGKWRSEIRADSGKQPGDPVRAVQAIIKAAESPKPPRHLLLGNDAYEGAMAGLAELHKDFSAVEKVARAADFPKGK